MLEVSVQQMDERIVFKESESEELSKEMVQEDEAAHF